MVAASNMASERASRETTQDGNYVRPSVLPPKPSREMTYEEFVEHLESQGIGPRGFTYPKETRFA